MHARGVVPQEERLPIALQLIHEALAVVDQHGVEALHVVFRRPAGLPVLPVLHVREGRQRTFVFYALTADAAPARHLRRVVSVGGPGMHEIARADLVPPVGREGVPIWVRHGVEVVQVAEELVEAVQCRQVLVAVAQVVLAELAGLVAHRLEHGGERDGLGRHADGGAGLADRGQAGTDRQLAGDEVGTTRGAARLGVVVGEAQACRRQPVEVRRAARHDPLVVGTDVEPADIVAHDDQDVRLPLAGATSGGRGGGRRLGRRRRTLRGLGLGHWRAACGRRHQGAAAEQDIAS